MTTEADALAALRRTDRLLAEQVAEWEAMEFGVAFVCPAFVALPEANQLRDAWLAEMDGEMAYARAEEYYAARGATCRWWTPASGQEIAPVRNLLAGKGWREVKRLAMAMAAPQEPTPTAAVRILPARAMPRAYRETFAGSAELAEASRRRLDDANFDAFVAMLDGRAAGRAAYLDAGDIGRLAEVYVLEPFRRKGVGRALVGQAIALARRLTPRAVIAAAEAGDTAGQAFLERAGFHPAAEAVHFVRPAE
jgi:GNAT superfamily N-acetyltransferase